MELFLPSDNEMILEELKKIEAQIERLRGDMQYFFSKVIDEQRQAACFAQMAPYENKIRSAWNALQAMHKNHGAENYQTYVNMFKDECANAQCSDAAHGLLNTLTGQGSFVQCDMLTVLYAGNPEGHYFKGVRDEVVSKSGYLQSLVAMGITSQSAYQSLMNNDKDAWKVVNNQFSGDVSTAINHIKEYNGICQQQLMPNVQENTMRLLHENPNLDNNPWSGILYNMAKTMAPEFLTQATVYNDISGFDNHYLTGYSDRTVGMLHLNGKYNMQVTYIDPRVGGPMTNSVNSPNPVNIVNSNTDAHNARYYANQISHADCWTGMMVVVNGLNYWTTGEIMNSGYMQFHPTTNANYVLQLWAQNGYPCIIENESRVAELLMN